MASYLEGGTDNGDETFSTLAPNGFRDTSRSLCDVTRAATLAVIYPHFDPGGRGGGGGPPPPKTPRDRYQEPCHFKVNAQVTKYHLVLVFGGKFGYLVL
jgi:hypothetical protein